MNNVADLEDVGHLLKNDFVAKDEFIEMMIICAIAKEHLLIVGPPGTGKSELVKRFAHHCSNTKETTGENVPYFEYLLTRFTEPNEIFGPVDIKTFQKGGGHQRITDGMLPRAEIAFLDEIFKANSAILNALLTLLNERIFYNGGKVEHVPLLCSIAATNEIPDDSSLGALYDRFLVRMWSENVDESHFDDLYQCGWKLEIDKIRKDSQFEIKNITTTDKIRSIHQEIQQVDMNKIAADYREVIRRIRSEGIALSDRRVIKLMKMVAASAIRHKRLQANTGDFWILKHIWNDPEQIPHLQSIVDPYLEDFDNVHWSAERPVESIEADISMLTTQQQTLKSDADFIDFLQKAEKIRREVLKHSNKEAAKTMSSSLKKLLNDTMALMQN